MRYADIFEEINVGFAQLHSIDRSENPSEELIIQKLSFLCDNVSKCFSKINGHHNGVCIKFLSSENDQRPKVLTLVRDSKSKINNRKTGTKDKENNYLDLNSDFDFIYSSFEDENINTTYYYEPNLPIKKDYRNSRLKSNWTPKEFNLSFIDNFIRRRSWTLSYKSTLVVPIVPLEADEQNQKSIRGFLCVDSPRENAFYKQFDVNILKGVCDGLYNKIDKLDELIKHNNEK